VSSSVPFRRRAAFLDFDGTLAQGGVMPGPQAEAVLRARAAGHAVLLSTGRPSSIVAADVAELFDGMITSAGAHIRLGEQLLRDVRFPTALARRTVEALEAHQADYALEAPEALWCTPRSAERLEARRGEIRTPRDGERGRGFADILDAIEVREELGEVSFAKISVWSAPVGIERIAAEIGEGIGALPSSISEDGRGSGELHLAELDKADGLALVADHLGFGIPDTVAIGDGPNDLGMLRAAGTGVAILGSRPEVLAAADEAVPGPSEHGVLTAFARLGML
jgi:hydroxymethylpyrimidine pyrophosphatase-like HAD family hydrolase